MVPVQWARKFLVTSQVDKTCLKLIISAVQSQSNDGDHQRSSVPRQPTLVVNPVSVSLSITILTVGTHQKRIVHRSRDASDSLLTRCTASVRVI